MLRKIVEQSEQPFSLSLTFLSSKLETKLSRNVVLIKLSSRCIRITATGLSTIFKVVFVVILFPLQKFKWRLVFKESFF